MKGCFRILLYELHAAIADDEATTCLLLLAIEVVAASAVMGILDSSDRYRLLIASGSEDDVGELAPFAIGILADSASVILGSRFSIPVSIIYREMSMSRIIVI